MSFVAALLGDLPAGSVPPAAALNVGRLEDGRLVLLEANQAWAAGLYSCDEDRALDAVIAASAAADSRWQFRPDLEVQYAGPAGT